MSKYFFLFTTVFLIFATTSCSNYIDQPGEIYTEIKEIDNTINNLEEKNTENIFVLNISNGGFVPNNLILPFNKTITLIIYNNDNYKERVEIPIYKSEFQGTIPAKENISIQIHPIAKGPTLITLNQVNVGTINVI